MSILKLPYVSEHFEGGGSDVFFGEEREFEPDRSDDQNFGGNHIYRSIDGIYAMTFDTYALTGVVAG